MKEKYKKTWLAFIQIVPKKGYKFSELIIESETDTEGGDYIGAWANVIVKSDSIENALKIIHMGIAEKMFEVEFIDKIENIQSLLDEEALNSSIISEIDWLVSSEYLFMISDKIFSYTEEE